ILYHHDQKIDAIYSNTDPSKTTMIKNILQGATTKYTLTILGKTIKKISLANITMQNKLMNQQQATILKNNPKMAQKIKQQTPKINNQSISNPTVHNHYIYGDSNSTYFNKIIPVLIGFFVFMFVFLISGISLLKERTSGTLDRMLATPVKRSEIIFGYMISYGILAIVQSIVIVFFAIWVMNVQVVGSIFSMIIINVLLALVALTIGLLLSTLTTSDFQMMQFIPVIVVPQLLFSGLVSLDSMGKWVQDITYIFPLRYAGDALNGIVMSGESLGHFGGDIIALLIFIIIFTVANVLSLKRYRKV
ncbi:ABC transporter permease, partial [Philodulcilactobacillus myokoensis]|uniref:ABC transporter permease n=1 Tax=Philodulcilactobacillus myokoensis TaxID=2929573 RepID=UPI002570CB60